MKLSDEVVRFAFLMEKLKLVDPRSLSLTELADGLQGVLGGIQDDLDSRNQSLRDGVNPKLFAQDCAIAANWLLGMVDNINQLPIVRHGLIEAMNDHCV